MLEKDVPVMQEKAEQFTAEKAGSVYNINAMFPIFRAAYAEGNRASISETYCVDHGVSTGFFDDYVLRVEKLFAAMCGYIDVKHNEDLRGDKDQAAKVKAARNKLFGLWKKVLECGEPEKETRSLKPYEDDVEDLVGFCQRFAPEKANVMFAKDFSVGKVWATQRFSIFRRAVETMLGIRIEQKMTMTQDEQDFVFAQNKLIGKVRKCEAKADESKSALVALSVALKGAKSEEFIGYLTAQVASHKAIIESCEKRSADLKKQLAELTMEKIKAAA